MSKIYRDYVWKDGIPLGIGGVAFDKNPLFDGYKIPMDPYRKRISIEKWSSGTFLEIIYDSALFDFRKLKPADQMAWHKFSVRETPESMECLICDQDDRVIVRELYSFDQGRCRECKAFSSHGHPISIQKMFYTMLQDPFNGVVLFDNNAHPVIQKKYAVDEETGHFTQLLEESWDMQTALPTPLTFQSLA